MCRFISAARAGMFRCTGALQRERSSGQHRPGDVFRSTGAALLSRIVQNEEAPKRDRGFVH